MATILVSFDDVKDLISQGLKDAFTVIVEADPDAVPPVLAGTAAAAIFEVYENQAALIVRDKSGINLSGTIPDWVVVPMAYIIQWLALHLMSQRDKEFIAECKSKYDMAIDRCKAADSSSVGYSQFGKIEGVNV